MEVYQRTA